MLSAQLELEGSLQAYVHSATKYDECELANFPHVKTRLTCHWVCVGKEAHNHHAVRRCAPDKIPVLPDKQVHVHLHTMMYSQSTLLFKYYFLHIFILVYTCVLVYDNKEI